MCKKLVLSPNASVGTPLPGCPFLHHPNSLLGRGLPDRNLLAKGSVGRSACGRPSHHSWWGLGRPQGSPLREESVRPGHPGRGVPTEFFFGSFVTTTCFFQLKAAHHVVRRLVYSVISSLGVSASGSGSFSAWMKAISSSPVMVSFSSRYSEISSSRARFSRRRSLALV